MAPLRFGALLILASSLTISSASLSSNPFSLHPASQSSSRPDRCPPCPECFNCQLPSFHCKQFATCNEFDGQCKCPPGFGAKDCGQPVCGSLADGDRRRVRPDNSTSCDCKPGWTGINCNVCDADDACSGLVPPTDGATGRPLDYLPTPSTLKSKNHSDAVCYKGGFTVKRSYQMCNVTNRKILDMLPGRPPQVSFSCDNSTSACQFQFWIGSVESFYCAFEQCRQSVDVGYKGQPNITRQECNKMKCKCIPGRMLCGESGSVDIRDFLREEIRGPGKFSCSSDHRLCSFEEPAMNGLITDIFGDTHITLDCQSGECLHYTMVPGFQVPARPDTNPMVVLSIGFTVMVVLFASGVFWYCGRNRAHEYPISRGPIRLTADEDVSLLHNHLSTDLIFSNISYSVPGTSKCVLRQVSGKATAGQLMAIMGASGAGKSSLLDILAKKSKTGLVEGDILINNQKIPNEQYKNLVGYVDQEDTLLSTLTVYETVLCSARLRLPRGMSLEAKKIRTLETLEELGILHLKDVFIGKSGRRSISGGEKRRVSIACELVTSPSVLFLDEPTSGLDSFNAYNVVEALAGLAKNCKRTVVFTVHQPQSNVLALFDQLVLLGKAGRLVYSGPFSQCHEYFQRIGYPCPPGYNIADFLIDLTMSTKNHDRSSHGSAQSTSKNSHVVGTPVADALSNSWSESARKTNVDQSGGCHRSAGQEVLPACLSTGGCSQDSSGRPSALMSSRQEDDLPILLQLTHRFAESELHRDLLKNLEATADSELAGRQETIRLTEYLEARGSSRVNLREQLIILSGRAFKNLYRNPMLVFSHYLLAIVLAGVCAGLFHGVTLDIGGFQGRMGLFFFILALFGFSSLTTITTFHEERLIFMRERSNNYYNPISYFVAKVVFDLIPLRIVPPFILGSIIYYPVGLVPSLEQFWKFCLVLISFNMVSSGWVMWISLLIEDVGVANLVGSLVMLFNLLFAGLLVNREKLPYGTRWLQDISYFHAAFEALLMNEVRYLTLKDHRYGVDIEVPSASILSLFGFRTTAFWWPDMSILLSMLLVSMVLACLTLVFFVKEKR